MSRLTPVSGRFLLDTNVVISLLEGDPSVLLNVGRADEVFLPAIVPGELFFGAAKSHRHIENGETIERLASGSTIVMCDLDVAREYGDLKHRLKEKGRPIPKNDIWIAAVARHHRMILVTRDAHFTHIDNLQTTDWATPA